MTLISRSIQPVAVEASLSQPVDRPEPSMSGQASVQHANKPTELSDGQPARKHMWTTGAFGPGRPDPWIQRKVAVGYVVRIRLLIALTRRLLIALTIWSFYVVVGRVCAPALRGDSVQGFGIGTGGVS